MGALFFPVQEGTEPRPYYSQRFDDEHPGIDVFAPAGAGVVAIAGGRVRHAQESRGGNVVYLVEPDGTQYFYGHLDAFADPMPPTETREVEAGELIGYVGNTGSAEGGPPHIHLEWRPQGGAKRDPFHMLERIAHGQPDHPAPVGYEATTPKARKKGGAGLFLALSVIGVIAYGLSRKGKR